MDKVLATIKKHNMLSEGDTVVIGLSGGADSVFLMYALLWLKDMYGLCFRAVHINHGIRGDEALRDENFVVDLCERMSIPLEVHKLDVKKEAILRRISEEEAGRIVRYAAFEKAAESCGGVKIAVAHNKNDSAETVLLNLCRGSGLSGLSGIPPVRGRVIRPLIDTSREEIEAFLHEHNISYVDDSTNSELVYSRNVIRQVIFPALREQINANALENIKNCADIAREEDGYLNNLALDGFEKCRVSDGLNITRLKEYPEVLQKRIIRVALKENSSLRNISSFHIKEILKLTHGISGKTVQLPDGIIARREFTELVFADKVQGHKDFYYDLVYNKVVYVKELDVYVKASPEQMDGGLSFFVCSGAVGLAARNRRPGDVIYFSSIGGHKKIKDFFIEQKIPADDRDKILLIAADSEVLWLTGLKRDVFSAAPVCKDNRAYEKIHIKIWKGNGS